MSDKEKVVAKYLLEDISGQLCHKPYANLLKKDFELIDAMVSVKVIPLLSNKERKKLLGLGTKGLEELQGNLDAGMIPKEGLLKYETLKAWKPPNKAPGDDGKLILARYFDFPNWKACHEFYLPLAKQVRLETTSEKRPFSIPFISINVRTLLVVAITIFIGAIAFSLFRMEQLFTRMAEDRPALPRQIDRPTTNPVFVSDSIGFTTNDSLKRSLLKPFKDLSNDENENLVNEKPMTVDPKAQVLPKSRVTIFIDEQYTSGIFFMNGQQITPAVTGANLLQFDVIPSMQPVEWLVVVNEDSCKQFFIMDPQLKMNWTCE